jgi:hypothetical protein
MPFASSRYMYSETLGRWHTVDLLVGLAYLSHRETMAYAALDIANRGQVVSMDQTVDKTKALLVRRSGRRSRAMHAGVHAWNLGGASCVAAHARGCGNAKPRWEGGHAPPLS